MSVNRRQFLTMGVAAGLSMTGVSVFASELDNPAVWLGATRYINSDHAAVRDLAADIARGKKNKRDQAISVHRFVSEQIRFGFTSGFWDNRASDVLRKKRGYCNTKSTLFTALLRACGIPARQVFVDIDASVLHGLIDPGTPYLDHSYVEVFLDDAWRPTDAYIVDPALLVPARQWVRDAGRLLGYGVHANGRSDWDGLQPSFSQFDLGNPSTISSRHYGVFQDVGDFYRRTENAWNRLNPPLRAAFGLLSRGANAAAARTRR